MIKKITHMMAEFDPLVKIIEIVKINENSEVYRVKREGKNYILKVARENSFSRSQLAYERKILPLLKLVKGVTHLVKDYYGSLDAILKEYFEGLDVNAYATYGKTLDVRAEMQMQETVREIHSRKIANLDLKFENFIISLDGTEARLIDLGTAKKYNWLSKRRFNCELEWDLKQLEGIIHKLRFTQVAFDD